MQNTELEDEYEEETRLHQISRGLIIGALNWSMMTLLLVLHCINAALPNQEQVTTGLSRLIIVTIVMNVAAIVLRVAEEVRSWREAGYSFRMLFEPDDDEWE